MSDSQEQAGFLAPDPADLNQLFPGYEIESLIATGGMGAVYCAIQKSLDRTVALKILPHEFSADAAFCAGFEAEAKAMARLNHPNLIGVYDFGEVNGMLFIIMEYVAGKSIYHSAHGKAINPGEVIRLVTGVCHGLAHAHENGIIHRDIKPSNILLDSNVQPKIGDFGLARPIERKVQEGEEIFGTPHYTAPEVVNAPDTVDYRADIFSVGVMLHELLTGKLPADDPRPPSVISRCDPRFDVIVRRATHAAPAGRYASAAEMAKDLAIIATSSGQRVLRPGVAAGPGHAGPRVAAPLRARRPVKVKKSSNSPALIIILLLVAAGVGAFVYLIKFGQPEKPVPVAPPKTSQAAPPPVIQQAEPESDPEPQSEPGAQPLPVPRPVPEAVVEPGVDPVPPDVTPETPAAALPKYDVAGFFTRARKIMQDRAKPYLTEHDANLRGNFGEFEKILKRQARKAEGTNTATESKLERVIEKWNGQGFRVPKDMDTDLENIPDVEATFTEYREKENAVDATFQRAIATLSSTYVLGLEKQIERLKTENDAPAINLIQKEIDSTKQSPVYFANLMLGTDPETKSPASGDR